MDVNLAYLIAVAIAFVLGAVTFGIGMKLGMQVSWKASGNNEPLFDKKNKYPLIEQDEVEYE